MKEALATGSERLVEDENRAGMDTGKRRKLSGHFLVARPAGKRNTLPDTACLGLHHWRNRSSSKRAASDDGAYCRNGCLALEHGA